MARYFIAIWNYLGHWGVYPALILFTFQIAQAYESSQPSTGNHFMKSSLLMNVKMTKETFHKGETIQLIWTLTNASSKELLIISHYAVANQRRHFDHLELRLQKQTDNMTWTFSLSGVRDATAKIGCLLQPGDSLKHEIDVSYWLSLQGINLGTGTYGLSAVYNIAPDEAKEITDWAKCSDINPSDTGDEPHLFQGKSQVPWHGSIISNMTTFMVLKK